MSYFIGDSLQLEYTLWRDKANAVAWDLTDYEIRFELFYSKTESVRKATSNVSGGDDAQILITDATAGVFVVYIDKEESALFPADNLYIEIEITSSTDIKNTIVSTHLKFEKAKIGWDTTND